MPGALAASCRPLLVPPALLLTVALAATPQAVFDRSVERLQSEEVRLALLIFAPACVL
jgi:hypothetical protein